MCLHKLNLWLCEWFQQRKTERGESFRLGIVFDYKMTHATNSSLGPSQWQAPEKCAEAHQYSLSLFFIPFLSALWTLLCQPAAFSLYSRAWKLPECIKWSKDGDRKKAEASQALLSSDRGMGTGASVPWVIVTLGTSEVSAGLYGRVVQWCQSHPPCSLYRFVHIMLQKFLGTEQSFKKMEKSLWPREI